MADQTQTRTIRIVVDATQAKAGGDAAEKTLKSIQQNAELAATSLSRIEGKLANAATALKAFLVTWAVDKISAFIAEMDKAVSGLGEMAEQMGISTNLLQAYQLAAVQSGVKTEELQTAISKFTRNVGEATQGNKEIIESFNRLGVKILDVKGNVRDTGQLMSEAAAKILMLSDASKQAAAAADLFGKGGQKMLTLLGEMSAGPNAMIDAAKRAGAVIDESVIKKMDEMNDRADAAQLKLRAMIAPLYADVKLTVLENLAALLKEIAQGGMSAAAAVSKLLSIFPGGGAGGAAGAVAGAVMGHIDLPPEIAAIDKQIAAAQAAKSSAQSELDALNASWMNRTFGRGDPAALNAAVAKANDDLTKLIDQRQRLIQRLQQNENQAVAGKGDAGPPGVANPIPKGSGEAAEKEFLRAKKALDDYVTGLQNEADASALSERQRVVMLAGIKAQTLAEEELTAAKKAGIPVDKQKLDLQVEQAKVAAGINFDRDKANRESQAEAQRQAELAMEPIKNAIRGVQSQLTDFYTQLYSGNIKSWKDTANAFKAIWIRMLAEISSYNTMRALGLEQILAQRPGTAGYPAQTGSPMPAGSSPFGGFDFTQIFNSGLGGVFGGGGSPVVSTAASTAGSPAELGGATGGSVGGISGWLGSLFGGASQTGASGSLAQGAGGMMGGMGSFMPYIGGALSIGTGVMQGMQGGRANAIAGYGRAVGGALMMIPTPWTMAAGAVITIGSQIAAMIIGNKQVKNQGTSSILLDPSAPPWAMSYATANSDHGSINSGDLKTANTATSEEINRLLYGVGAKFAPGAIGGYILHSSGKNTGDQYGYGLGDYQLGAHAVGPNAPRELGIGLSAEEATTRLIGAVIQNAANDDKLISDGSGFLSETILKVLKDGTEDITEDQIRQNIETAKTYDQLVNLARPANDVHTAIEAIREQFHTLSFDAGRLGLDLDKLNGVMNDQVAKIGTDFLTGLSDQVLQQSNPLAFAKLQNTRSYQTGLDSLNALLQEGAINADQFANGLDNLNKLLKQANDNAVASASGGAVGSIIDLMRSLTYGQLSLANPTQTLAGLQATYAATLAQAQGGDAAALGRFPGQASTIVDYVNHYYGGNAQAAAFRAQVIADAGGLAASNGSSQPATSGDIQMLLRAVLDAVAELQKGNIKTDTLTDAIEQFGEAVTGQPLTPSSSTVLDQAA